MGSSWWVTLNNFKDWLLSLNCLIHEVETDSMTLRNAVLITLPVLDALLPKLKPPPLPLETINFTTCIILERKLKFSRKFHVNFHLKFKALNFHDIFKTNP